MVKRDNRPVVVGIDGSAGSRAALSFAIEEGLARGVTVEVVTTWLMGPPLSDVPVPTSFEEEQQRAQAVQDTVLNEVLAGYDEKPAISQVVLHNYSGHTLVDSARDAAMLVVGSGRKGVLARTLLGSVSEYCVRHAVVPVVVVPDPSRLGEEAPAGEVVQAEAAPAE